MWTAPLTDTYCSMVALPIDDCLQPHQQEFHEVPQKHHRIFKTLIWFLENFARKKVFNLGQ
jgi:hypothetical protein